MLERFLLNNNDFVFLDVVIKHKVSIITDL